MKNVDFFEQVYFKNEHTKFYLNETKDNIEYEERERKKKDIIIMFLRH